jgi:hypothetical protein
VDLEMVVDQLAANAERIRALVQGVTLRQARWKPDETRWSILEVIVRLYDEEREDFRSLLGHVLHRPDERWPRLDDVSPQEWVRVRRYNERDPDAALGDFLAARADSTAWLRGLGAPDWSASYEMPFGPITAGDVSASWVAHDLLHMRQLVRLHWLHTTAALAPYKVAYAGRW